MLPCIDKKQAYRIIYLFLYTVFVLSACNGKGETAMQSQPHQGVSKTSRQVTVSYVRKRHQDPETFRTRRMSRHPSLVLSGDWLEEAGFPTGTPVAVSVAWGRLILSPVEVE